MKDINNYIIEKFEINKNTKVQQVDGFNIQSLGKGRFITFRPTLLNNKIINGDHLLHVKDLRDINEYISSNDKVYYIENCDYYSADINSYLITAQPKQIIGNSLNKCKIYILGNHEYFDNLKNPIGGITVLEHLYKTNPSQNYSRDIYIYDKILL